MKGVEPARALLLLALAAAARPLAGAAHYAEYEAARADDYREHSPDAPVLPDYKYEEEANGKDKEIDDLWQKPGQKRRKHRDDDYSDVLEKHIPEEDMNLKLKNHRHASRGRAKSDVLERDVEVEERKRGRSPIDDEDIAEGEKDDRDKDFREEENDRSRDEDIKHAKISEKSGRRRPRDKTPFLDDDDQEELLTLNKGSKGHDDTLDLYKRILGGPRRSGMLVDRLHGAGDRPRHGERRPAGRRRPGAGSLGAPGGPRASKPAYEEYSDDYFEPKRATDNRIGARVPLPPQTSTTLAVGQWLSNRRMFNPASSFGEFVDNSKPQRTTTPARTTAAPITRTTIRRSVPSTTLTVTTTTKTTLDFGQTTTEQSLAEKSRLSILRKIRRKEGVKAQSRTMKPPVLLQVTNKVPTLVMVEPLPRATRGARVRLVAADSPQRVANAKRLMRRKLVRNARSVRELTDNWDDVICDYIDLTMLDEVSAAPPAPAPSLALLYVVLLFCD